MSPSQLRDKLPQKNAEVFWEARCGLMKHLLNVFESVHESVVPNFVLLLSPPHTHTHTRRQSFAHLITLKISKVAEPQSPFGPNIKQFPVQGIYSVFLNVVDISHMLVMVDEIHSENICYTSKV